MVKNTSVSLGADYEALIDRLVKSGRYATRAEVIRDGLRRLEVKEKKNVPKMP